jgi:hypothetical protein
MIHELIPWNTLTRFGVPALKVARRPLVIGEVVIPVGEKFDPELFPPHIRRERLRQFYEMRRLELVNPPVDSRQYFREQLARAEGQEVPITPIQPVASRIVADVPVVDLPIIEVPLEESSRRPPAKPAKGVR